MAARDSDGLNIEWLRFEQLSETIDAFMGTLTDRERGEGDVHSAMAGWASRRFNKGRAAFLAYDVVGLKRLNDECERAFAEIEHARF